MSDGTASITFEWGDGSHTFRLGLGELKKLQAAVNKERVSLGLSAVGPRGLLKAFVQGDDLAEDPREVIRWGLIGGGTTPTEAARLLKLYCDGRPLREAIEPAFRILSAAVVGPELDSEVGKAMAEEATTETTMGRSPSPPSTDPAPRLDGMPAQSIN